MTDENVNQNFPLYDEYLNNPTDASFKFEQGENSAVLHFINKLKRSHGCGCDKISSNMLKIIAKEVSHCTTLIIDQTLSTGIFPSKLKTAKIIPIYKKNDKTLLKNYRPISTLPVVFKIVENVIHNQMMDYFTLNELLSSEQCGFRPNNNLQYKVRKDLSIGDNTNSIFVEIERTHLNSKYNTIIGCIYRPPSFPLKSFNDLLIGMLSILHNEKKHIYLAGDYNVNTDPLVKGDTSIQNFKHILSSNFLFPLINKPTRVTHQSATVINCMLSILHNEKKHIYLAGDYNVNTDPLVRGDTSIQNFKHILSSNFLFPLINKPTRVTHQSATVIDNIYCNASDIAATCKSGVLRISISDHYAIFCIINNSHIKAEKETKIRRNYYKKSIPRFNKCLKEQSWISLNTFDLQEAFSWFQRVIDLHIEEHFPKQTITINYKNRLPCLTEKHCNQIKVKNALHTEIMLNPADHLLKLE